MSCALPTPDTPADDAFFDLYPHLSKLRSTCFLLPEIKTTSSGTLCTKGHPPACSWVNPGVAQIAVVFILILNGIQAWWGHPRSSHICFQLTFLSLYTCLPQISHKFPLPVVPSCTTISVFLVMSVFPCQETPCEDFSWCPCTLTFPLGVSLQRSHQSLIYLAWMWTGSLQFWLFNLSFFPIGLQCGSWVLCL